MATQTKARIPRAVSTYSHSTMDPEIRSQIHAILHKDGHIQNIQTKLEHALMASSSNWADLIQKRALELLRTRECVNFDQCMKRIIADIKADTAARQPLTNGASTNGNSTNGVLNGHGEGGASLALPRNVVDEGLKITRQALDLICAEED